VRKALATLALATLAGCNSATGLLSRDLDSLSVDLYPDRPALVRGHLRSGINPAAFVVAASSGGVAELAIGLGESDLREMSASLADAAEPPPIRISTPASLASGRVEAFQKGLYWAPSYEWTIGADSFALCASVEMVNLTGQEWLTPVSICDFDGERIGGSSIPMTLEPGSRSLFWWSVATADVSAVLSFGWPAPGRWSALIAIPAPGNGPFLPAAGEPWMQAVHDTIWRSAVEILDVTQQMTPQERGYSGLLTVGNVATWPVTAIARSSNGLASGAAVTFPGMPDSLVLEPGESRQIVFWIIYPD
jgi:hypothetical protein